MLLGASIVLAPTPRVNAGPETVFSTPKDAGRPAPVNLGDGIILTDYRVYPASPLNRIVGEIRNTTDRMIDAPVVSIYYPVNGEEGAGFAYGAPVLPVIEAGGTVPIFGTIPEGVNPDVAIASADFALCTPAEPGKYTDEEAELSLELFITSEKIKDTSYRCDGEVINMAASAAKVSAVYGIFRDPIGRVAGFALTVHIPALEPAAIKPFTLWGAERIASKGNPYLLTSGTNYTVDVRAGTRGPTVTPGCSFGLPWE